MGKRRQLTVCRNKHVLTEQNTRVIAGRGRRCLDCARKHVPLSKRACKKCKAMFEGRRENICWACSGVPQPVIPRRRRYRDTGSPYDVAQRQIEQMFGIPAEQWINVSGHSLNLLHYARMVSIANATQEGRRWNQWIVRLARLEIRPQARMSREQAVQWARTQRNQPSPDRSMWTMAGALRAIRKAGLKPVASILKQSPIEQESAA